MDEEQSNSYVGGFLFLDQLGEFINPLPTPLQHPIQHPAEDTVPPMQVKALRVEQMYEGCPEDLQKSFFDSSFKNKFFTGIRGLFGIRGRQDESTKFLDSIGQDLFAMEDIYEDLPVLFPQEKSAKNPQEQISEQLDDLTKKLSEIQQKSFSSISMNKTIGQAFTMHFQNFLYVREQSNFMQKFQKALNNLFAQAKKIKSPGTALIVLIYEFWMKMFKDFVREIWRHSENYTLSLFKKQKVGEAMNQGSNCARSTTSSSQNGLDKEKRRAWAKSEIQLLQKIIDSNAVFSTSRIQDLANELERSASSITSKITKIIKLRKAVGNQKVQETSVESKIKFVLENNPGSLTRQDIINCMNESYEMGIDECWKNSVSSILSSSKLFQKVKAPYKLKNPTMYFNYTFSNNFKDKVIRCLLSLPNNSGDVRTICQKYSQIYHDSSSEQKLNISKTLARYDCFQRETSKILYQLAGSKERSQFQIDQFIK